jgi:hypothetical protein
MDVEASRAIRQAEVGASKTMIERTQERFDIKPERRRLVVAGRPAWQACLFINYLRHQLRFDYRSKRSSKLSKRLSLL